MARAISFSFAAPGQASQYFGWGLAGLVGRDNGLDGFHAYDNSSAVKPVLNVAAARRPFKVVSSVVELIFVNVMNYIKVQRVRHEDLRHNAMDKRLSGARCSHEFDSHVAVISNASCEDLRSIEASHGTTHVTTDTLQSAEIADLVTHGIGNVSPLFAGETAQVNLFGHYAKVLLNRCLDVKLFGFVSDWVNKPSHQEPVVRANGKHFFSDVTSKSASAIATNACLSANSELVRKFVSISEFGDNQPVLHPSVSSLHGTDKPLAQKGQASLLTLKKEGI